MSFQLPQLIKSAALHLSFHTGSLMWELLQSISCQSGGKRTEKIPPATWRISNADTKIAFKIWNLGYEIQWDKHYHPDVTCLPARVQNVLHFVRLDFGVWHLRYSWLKKGHQCMLWGRNNHCFSDFSYSHKKLCLKIFFGIYCQLGEWHVFKTTLPRSDTRP